MKSKIMALTTILFLGVFLIAGIGISYIGKIILQNVLVETLNKQDEINNIVSRFNQQNIKVILIVVLICGILSFIAFAVYFNRVFKGLEDFKGDLIKISEGQLAVRVKSNGFLDELAKSANTIVNNTKKILSEIAEVSQKNRDLTLVLQKNTKQTEAAAGEIANSVLAIAESVSKQSQDASSTGESTKLMAENAGEIAEHASDTQSIAEEMIKVIKENGEVFNNIILKMKSTGDISNNLANSVKELQNEADQINNIAKVVTEISDRTNLLALNAAIEAARAGEHGKGFSVVAEEVRKLAEQSSSSAGEIRKLIEDITDKITKITQEADMQVKGINEDILFADKSKDSFTKITESTQSTYKAVNAIQQLAKDTYTMSDNVNDLVNDMISSTQESLAFTQEVSASAEEQTVSMQELTGLIDKINESADGIDLKLKEFINNINIGEKEEKIIKGGFDKLKDILKELDSRSLGFDNSSKFLKELLDANKEFEYIGIIDSKGIMRSASHQISKDNNDFSFRPYFRESMNGNEYSTEPYISNVSFNYCIAISVPMKDSKGNINGVIMADICIEQ